MKRKAHKLRKAAAHPTSTGGPRWRRRYRHSDRWWRCTDMRCPLHHPNNATQDNLGPPGVKKLHMWRTRPVRIKEP